MTQDTSFGERVRIKRRIQKADRRLAKGENAHEREVIARLTKRLDELEGKRVTPVETK
jgi:hypothetical protein